MNFSPYLCVGFLFFSCNPHLRLLLFFLLRLPRRPPPHHLLLHHTYHHLTISSHLISSHLISSHLISSHLISSHLISSHLISSHLISSHLISSHLISSHLISSHLISSHLISSHLISSYLISSHLISSHLISSHLISSHLISSHLISSHLISSHLISSSHRISPSHHLIISSSHRISSSHHLIISSSHHLISSSHHLIISSHHLIISSHLIISLSHHLRASRKGCGAPGRRGPRLLSVCGRRSTSSLQKGLRRAWSPWAAAPVCVAGGYFEPPKRVAARLVGVGRGSCRRGPRLLSVWKAQYLEHPERVAARLVAVGRGFCLCGRRSTWSLQKGLRRAWSPWAAAPVCVAGAILRASRKGCGARVAGAVLGASRKGCGAPGRLLSVWQAQYSEPLERVAARLVAVGRGCCLCGKRSTWRFQKGLRRAWSPWAAVPVCVAGAVLGTSRGLRRAWSLWAAAPVRLAGAVLGASIERVAARLVAVGRGFCLRGRRSIWSLQKGLRRAWSPWAAAPVRVAGAVLRASRKGCGAPGRRRKGCSAPGRRGPRLLWQAQYLEVPERVAARLVAVGRRSCLCGRRSTWSVQKGLRRTWSPWAAAPVCVAGAVLGTSRKGCGAPGRRGPRLLSVWQAQYLERPERVAARLVAVGRGSCLCGRRSTWNLQKGLRRAWSPWAAAAVCAAGAVFGASRNGLAACCV